MTNNAEIEKSIYEAVKRWADWKESQIKEIAYLKWERAGKPEGSGVDFWTEAEAEWNKNNFLGPQERPVLFLEDFQC